MLGVFSTDSSDDEPVPVTPDKKHTLSTPLSPSSSTHDAELTFIKAPPRSFFIDKE